MIVLRLPDGDVLVIYPDDRTIRIWPDGSTLPADALGRALGDDPSAHAQLELEPFALFRRARNEGEEALSAQLCKLKG